ncbi:MAG: DUF6713 family protein [Patescibacteria group bacterium]|jgi:hypothetical protein
MNNLLILLYISNATLLIIHEIDSAYWKEWELFKLPGGITGFLLLHIPLVGFILYGTVCIALNQSLGLYLSLALSGGGIFAFGIHNYFMSKGHRQFTTRTSKTLLAVLMVTSVAEGIVTVLVMIK